MKNSAVSYEELCKAFKQLKKEKLKLNYNNSKKIVGDMPVSTFYVYKARFLNNVKPTENKKSNVTSTGNKDYFKGWKDAIKSVKVYITSQLQKGF